MALNVEGASEIEHRVEALAIDLVDVQGAAPVGEPRTIGRTRSLVLRPTAASYELRYRATQSDERAYRCPMWLPTTPTDGISRTVRFLVDVPASATPGGSMPAMAWTGTRGTTTLGHVPAFVRVPFALGGDPPGWDVARVMDAAAVVVFAGASGLWIWRRRR